jgi:ABC-type sugar transport system ATPase subunit
MIFDEPTAGVDVGARAEFHRLLRELSEDGMAILMSSAEPEEIALVCSRALVLVEGQVAHEFHPPLSAEDLVGASYSGR